MGFVIVGVLVLFLAFGAWRAYAGIVEHRANKAIVREAQRREAQRREAQRE